MTTITVTTEQIVDFLDGITDLRFLDKAVFEAIGEELKKNTQDRFEKEIDPAGKKWKPLDAKYAKRKAKKATHNKILQFGGYLHDELHTVATDKGMQFGSNRKYAAIQQFGGKVGKVGKIPARPFIGISDEDRQAIRDKVRDAWNLWVSKQ